MAGSFDRKATVRASKRYLVDFTPSNLDIPEDERKRLLVSSTMEVMMGHRSKVRGKRLDQLCDDNVFYVERGKIGFLIVEGCNAAP